MAKPKPKLPEDLNEPTVSVAPEKTPEPSVETKQEPILLETLTETALGFLKVDKHFEIVVIKYNPVTKQSQIVENINAGEIRTAAEDKFRRAVVQHRVFRMVY